MSVFKAIAMQNSLVVANNKLKDWKKSSKLYSLSFCSNPLTCYCILLFIGIDSVGSYEDTE